MRSAELREQLATAGDRLPTYLRELEVGTVKTRRGRAVPIFVHSTDSTAYGLGDLLVDVDREFRRSMAVLGASPGTGRRRRQDLQVIAAQDGRSIDVVLAAYHALSQVILSDPLQLIMSLEWLWDRRPIRWGVKRPPAQRTIEEIAAGVIENANVALNAGHSVAYALHVDAAGSMDVQFVAAPGDLPPVGPIRPTPIEPPGE